MRNLANILKGLADETRLMILALLFKKGELCVCDFVEVLQISQSKSSRHLRYLLNAGFLSDRRNGIWVNYRISENLSDDHKIILKSLKILLAGEKTEVLLQKLNTWLKTKECKNSICGKG